MKLSAALGGYWWRTTTVREASDAFATALPKADAVSARDRGRLLYGAGVAAGMRGDWNGSLALLGDALEIFDRGDEPRQAIECLWAFGYAYACLGDLHQTFQTSETAVDRARGLGDPYALATSLNNLACAEFKFGNLERARKLAAEGVDRAREAGDLVGLAVALHSAAQVADGLGLHEEAASQFGEALRVAQAIGSLESALEALISLAEAHAARGDVTKAARLLGACTRLGDRAGFIPQQSAEVDRAERIARERLGDDVFDAAWREGAAMTLDEAIDDALS